MSKTRLDLSGINLNDLRRPRRSKRQGLHIEPQPTIEVIETRPGVPYKYICVCLFIMCLCFVAVNFSYGGSRTAAPRKRSVHRTGQLRKMIRMKCRSKKMVTYCTTTQNAGDYVVSINGCKDIFEFNGIPFTDVYKDKNGNYRVPSSMDHTLRIKDHCSDIAATVDTDEQSYEEYASSHLLSANDAIEKIVWITDSCYKDFTVSIDNENIYEATPASMITSYQLEKKVAYVYETDVHELKGGINIEGEGVTSLFISIQKV